jgi:hypothetical protein
MIVRQKWKNIKVAPLKARRLTRQLILTLPYRAPEYKLDKYFRDNHNLTLCQVCLKIWNNLKYIPDIDNELVILLQDKELQKLAQFITFGNREFQGSKILQYALLQRGVV